MLEVGFAAHLFFDQMTVMGTDEKGISAEVEARLAAVEPEVELLLCERVAAERLRLVIDHPGGVDLALCERVTHHLRDLLVDYGLEVSSPGPQRPLTKPDHFRRFVGRKARVRTRAPLAGHKSFTGELVGASEEEVTLAVPTRQGPDGTTAEGGVVSIPFAEIHRSNLLRREEKE